MTKLTLRKSSEFTQLITQGKKRNVNKWMFFNYKSNNFTYFRFGLTTSRKIGTAVIRNKLKRWFRVCVQAHSKSDELVRGYDINVVLKITEDDFYKKLKFSEFQSGFEEMYQFVRKLS